jgi:amino acid adenylation domain-containing protein
MKNEHLIYDFNKTDAAFPESLTIQQLFEEQVKRTPDECAVFFGDKMLTYNQLNNKANQLANFLRSLEVKPDDVIALAAERSMEMIIGIWGIIKSGCAYLPVAPDSPVERTNYVLSNSGVKILLIQNSACLRNNFDASGLSSDNPSLVNKPQDLLYVIYTSGSTGKPKGVMIEHRSVINRLNWMQKQYPLSTNDIILQKTPFYFDVSVWELFWWSLNGAAMSFLVPGGEKIPSLITDAVKKYNVTVMHFVPSMLSVFLEHLENKGDAEITKLKSLKYLFASGESLTASHVKKFNDIIAKKTGTSLVNLYGPTEATVDATYFNCPSDDDIDKVPIGKPIDNTKIFIVSENKILSLGEIGEICIAGAGLARGYINNEELTAERFVNCPFLPGERMYRTGDRGRWLSDGNIEFLGRQDYQVKIRGLRIELGEIENVIRNFHDVKDSVVIAKKYSDTIIILTAYLVTKSKINIPELKEFLKQYLPDYMIPGNFLEINEIPLMPNGKADRKALPQPISVSS